MSRFMSETEPIRKYLYGLLTPALGLLVVYGLIEAEAVALWSALGVAVLVPAGVELARNKVTPLARPTDTDGSPLTRNG